MGMACLMLRSVYHGQLLSSNPGMDQSNLRIISQEEDSVKCAKTQDFALCDSMLSSSSFKLHENKTSRSVYQFN